MEGSDLTSKLTGVVKRCRKERVAFMAAIDECLFKSRFQEKSELPSLLMVAEF